jgi:signal transduction histidine kinase
MAKSPDQATIMVVDDTPTNLKLLQEILQVKNYRVLTIPDGQMALSAAASHPPDLILLDINMPGMNGFEVCERLKAEAALGEIPVIFITALAEPADKVRAFAVGGVDYVTKPFQAEEVQARVETHLTLYRQKRQLQASYEHLRELETLRDSLVHMVVHDMRSSLMIVLGRLKMAQRLPQPERGTKNITKALETTHWLVEMVNSLLDMSKMEAGQLTPKVSSVDLNELVTEMLPQMEPFQGQRRLTFTSPEPIVAIPGDPTLLRRVLQNLMVNALKFTAPAEGRITVSLATVGGGWVRVSVADNGPGISPEYQEKVFDKFYQVAARQQGEIRSTGLGLTFCKMTVEAHGGRIGLDSAKNQGSTFWFELPGGEV